MMTVKIVDFFHPIDIDINDADGSIFPGFKMTERVHKGVPVQRVCQQIMVARFFQKTAASRKSMTDRAAAASPAAARSRELSIHVCCSSTRL